MSAITEPVSVAGASATIVKTVSVGVADPTFVSRASISCVSQ
jgi:hypothetical protein